MNDIFVLESYMLNYIPPILNLNKYAQTWLSSQTKARRSTSAD
jgi:hypothetical protein